MAEELPWGLRPHREYKVDPQRLIAAGLHVSEEEAGKPSIIIGPHLMQRVEREEAEAARRLQSRLELAERETALNREIAQAAKAPVARTAVHGRPRNADESIVDGLRAGAARARGEESRARTHDEGRRNNWRR